MVPPSTVEAAQESLNAPTVFDEKTSTLLSSLSFEQGSLGIANIPNQTYRMAMKQGVCLNLLFAGQGDVGKKSFLQSLLDISINVPPPPEFPPFSPMHNPPVNLLGELSTSNGKDIIALASQQIPQEAILDKLTANFVEKSMPVKLSIINVSKYGNGVNQANSWDKIVSFVDAQYEQYLEQELSTCCRTSITDNRIHACLYFLAATATSINKLDLITMKKLSERLLVIPVITKAEILTVSERANLKTKIKKTLQKYDIQTLMSPSILSLFREEGKDAFTQRSCDILDSLPFAITNNLNSVDGCKEKGRMYPWGTIEMEDEIFSDFSKLRALLIRTHLFKILQTSHSLFFENFRMNHLLNRLLSGENFVHPFVASDIEKRFKQGEEQLKKKYEFTSPKLHHMILCDDVEYEKKREKHRRDVRSMQDKIALLEEKIINARTELAAANAKLASFTPEEVKATAMPQAAN